MVLGRQLQITLRHSNVQQRNVQHSFRRSRTHRQHKQLAALAATACVVLAELIQQHAGHCRSLVRTLQIKRLAKASRLLPKSESQELLLA